MPESFLDPVAISRGETLGVLARRIVEGYRVGEHRSPLHGFAIEFAQHREYAAGDDPKHLDWKLLGKTDRLFLKQYEQDTNFVATLLVDASSSMAYGSTALTKLHYAKVLAACLAQIVLSQRDAVALEVFDSTVRSRMRRTDNPRRMGEILERLAGVREAAGTDFGRVLRDVASTAQGRGITFLFSDLFGDEKDFQRGIERLTFQGSEVVVFHVLDHDERTFPFQGPVRFEGLENEGAVETHPASIRQSYLAGFQAFLQRVRRICETANAHYVLADTSVPVAETLVGYLAYRQRVTAR